MNGNCYYSEGINPTLTCNKNEGNRVAIPVADIDTNHGFNQRGTVHDVDGISRTIMGCGHSGNEPKVAIPVITPEREVKRQQGRRFKDDGEEMFTLTSQDKHGVAVNVEVEPVTLSGYELSENGETARTLNCTDQRKIFGAHQARTMVGYNATLNGGGYDASITCPTSEGLQRIIGEQTDDDCSSDVFAIDKGYEPEEREVANCIESREDRGLSRRKQEGTLICIKV